MSSKLHQEKKEICCIICNHPALTEANRASDDYFVVVEHAAHTKRVLRFIFCAIRNFIVERTETLCAMTICIRAHVRYWKAEDFREWLFWFHLIVKAAGLFEDAR